MKVTALLRVGRNVTHLESAAAFYGGILGFQAIGPVIEDVALAALLGVEKLRLARMRLGAREIELTECFPKSLAYPAAMRASDLAFQHIAIVTSDIRQASLQVLRHGAEAISRAGPVRLPASSGGVRAFKFRDPDGHPLEFLQFPERFSPAGPGYDHSAIVVSDIEKSVAFYAGMGLSVGARQVNRGPEQNALDGLPDVTVDVLALRPAQPSPHVELLCYRGPDVALAWPYAPADICADRLIFGASSGGVRLLRDGDGHVILIDGR